AQLRRVGEILRGGDGVARPGAAPVRAEAFAELDEGEPVRRGPEISLQDMTFAPPAAELPPGRPSFSDVRALREELSTLELGRRQGFGSGGYLAPALIGVVAAGLAVAVGLAVAGYVTAAVIVLAAFALGIALLSMFGAG